MTPEDSIWKAARLAGVSSVELLVNEDLVCPDLAKSGSLTDRLTTSSAAGEMRKEAADEGVGIGLFVAPLRLVPAMSEAPEWTTLLLERARSSGADKVSFPLVTDNFMVPEISDQAYLDSALAVFSSLVKASAATGTGVLFENLSVYLNRTEILGRILEAFTREELGFCLDPVNLLWYGHPRHEVYHIAESLAGRSTALHIKNISYPDAMADTRREPGWGYDKLVVPASEGDLDFSLLISRFRQNGFSGYYGIEDDSLPLVPSSERMKILRSSVSFVESLLGDEGAD